VQRGRSSAGSGRIYHHADPLAEGAGIQEVIPGSASRIVRAINSPDAAGVERGGIDLTQAAFDNLRIPVPSLLEQESIARFIQHHISITDVLIEEQRRLIALLKEKRYAVISHAVTNGLDAATTMKEFGIEWVCKVPQHWEVQRLRRTFQSVAYGISDSLDAEQVFAVLRMGNIENGRITMNDLKYITDVDPDFHLKNDDLLYNRTNSLDLIGKVGRFLGSTEPVTFASYLVRLRLTSQHLSSYLRICSTLKLQYSQDNLAN